MIESTRTATEIVLSAAVARSSTNFEHQFPVLLSMRNSINLNIMTEQNKLPLITKVSQMNEMNDNSKSLKFYTTVGCAAQKSY